MKPLVSHDADAIGITDQKCHVASHLDYFDLRNGMVPLMTLLASCNTDTSISGAT